MDGGDLPFVNLELNDSPMGLDPSSSTRPRRFPPKLKANSIHSSSSAPQPPPPPPPRPDQAAAAPSPRSPAPPPPPPPPLETEQSVAAVAPMEEDDAEEEDTVVREIDVYCCPLEGDAQLYVMQYPLRPYWRPYELEERCEEVKVNSKSSEVELILRAHDDSDPYDEDEPKPTKNKEQILKSSRSIYPVDIVAGTLIKNQLYLNPVHEVLQFRPSLDHLNDDGVQKGKHKVGEVGNKSEKTTISLQFHETNSSFSRRYYQKMLVQRDDPIDFTMNQYDYLHSFCRAPSTDKRTAKVSPSSFKPSLPLEERLKEYLRTVSQLNRFDALRHLDSSAPEEEFLKMLDRHALLVQGLWVSKSSLFFEGRNANLRDYILFLFSQSHAVKASKLSNLLRPEHLRKLLRPLAYERPTMKDWKLREERDTSFIKGHMQIVKDQENAWLNQGKDLEESMFKGRNVQSLSSMNRPAANMAKRKLDADKVDITSNGAESGGRGNLPAASMSTEYRESLHTALHHIFKDRNARSMNTILRDLRELAISFSGRAKEGSKMKALVDAISNAASSQTPELMSVLKDVAYRVHNMYVFRSGLNPAHNPFRGAVVKLFCEKESNVELKKQEIVEAVKTMLNKEISESEYDQVVKDLCVHRNGGWALRTVDNLE